MYGSTFISTKNYIEQKCKVLSQLGMTDTPAIKSYLQAKVSNVNDNVQKEIRLDNICRTMIVAYFDGDRTFVKGNH